MTETDAKKLLELLFASDVDDNDPMIQQVIRDQRRIRVSLRESPPGTGKTSTLFNEWKRLGDYRKLYLSQAHELLTEQANRIGRDPDVRHIKGLSYSKGSTRMCPCNTEDYPSIKFLIELGAPNKYICETCEKKSLMKQKDCPYHIQFKNLKEVPIVVAPVNYAFTDLLKKQYQPDFIALDDCLMNIQPQHSRVDIEKALIWLSTSIGETLTLKDLINRSDRASYLQELEKTHEMMYRVYIDEIGKDAKKDVVATISPTEINEYCELALKYHGFRDRFATPALFPLFDYIFEARTEDNQPQLKIMDAIINHNFLSTVADRYQKERNVTVNFEFDGFEPHIVNRGSVVYRYGRDGAWYPAVSIMKHPKTVSKIREDITDILRTRYNDNKELSIGIVTFRDASWKWFIPKKFNDNVKDLHFGDVRGLNILENCDVLFVVGTYSINKKDMVQTFSDWFARDPSSIDYKENKPHGDWYHFKDPEMEHLRWTQEDYEMYQTIHRARPFLKKIDVHVFGVVPIEIENEKLTVTRKKGVFDMDEKYLKWLVEYVKVTKHGIVQERIARLDMQTEFAFTDDRAYRTIRKILKDCEQIRSYEDKIGHKILESVGV